MNSTDPDPKASPDAQTITTYPLHIPRSPVFAESRRSYHPTLVMRIRVTVPVFVSVITKSKYVPLKVE